MALYDDSAEIESITGKIKEQISVGICGSFTDEHIPILKDLCCYLKEHGYSHVFTAQNFPATKPRITSGDEKYADTLKTSMTLVNTCDIVIVFFFAPNSDPEKDEPEVNQSALLEIQEMYREGKQNVVILAEEGFRFRSNLKGIRSLTKDMGWNWNNFTKDKIADGYTYVKQICHNIILEQNTSTGE